MRGKERKERDEKNIPILLKGSLEKIQKKYAKQHKSLKLSSKGKDGKRQTGDSATRDASHTAKVHA